jgi:hypothetical protein
MILLLKEHSCYQLLTSLLELKHILNDPVLFLLNHCLVAEHALALFSEPFRPNAFEFALLLDSLKHSMQELQFVDATLVQVDVELRRVQEGLVVVVNEGTMKFQKELGTSRGVQAGRNKGSL